MSTEEAFKNCPNCGKVLEETWIVCPYCGGNLTGAQKLQKRKLAILSAIFGLISLIFGIVALFSNDLFSTYFFFLVIFGFPLGLVAVVFGAIATAKEDMLGIVGIILGNIGVAWALWAVLAICSQLIIRPF